jgi:hypothetical protein
MALAYIDKITSNRTAFEQKVKSIASRLGINPDWLMIVMYAESRLNHLAENPNSSAAGLIQFLSKTLLQLGISKTQLLSMTNVEQLDYVEKYFVMQGLKGKMKSYYDVAFGVFLPKYVGASDSTVIASSGTDTYNANRGMDTDGDGKLTVADVKRWYGKYVPTNVQPTSNQNTFLYIALGVLVFYLLYQSSEQEDSEAKYVAQFQS